MSAILTTREMKTGTVSGLGPSNLVPLSKNAQKRLAKAARLAEHKKERRASEKVKRKQKKRERAEQQKAEDGDDPESPRKKAKTDQGPKQPFGARIVVDLGFDELMTENEIKSLTSQLAFTYSANRKASHPFSTILFTGLSGRTFTRLENMSDAAYKRWIDTDWWQEGYERLWERARTSAGAEQVETNGELYEQNDATAKEDRAPSTKQSAQRGTIVYLTADSSEELTDLKEEETYIIGGIVDHNRYKNLCLKKSLDTEIRSARLPIGTFLSELKTRKVLTVNQTFEILLKWVETRDWEHALHSVVPKRKFSVKDREEGQDRSENMIAGGAEDETKVVVGAEYVEEGRADMADMSVVDSSDMSEAIEHGT